MSGCGNPDSDPQGEGAESVAASLVATHDTSHVDPARAQRVLNILVEWQEVVSFPAVLRAGIEGGAFVPPVSNVLTEIIERGAFECNARACDSETVECTITDEDEPSVVIGRALLTPLSIGLCDLQDIRVGRSNNSDWDIVAELEGTPRRNVLNRAYGDSDAPLTLNAVELQLAEAADGTVSVNSLASSIGPYGNSREELALLNCGERHELEGSYENHRYDDGGKNNWHYVTITQTAHDEFTWTNRAGRSWTLRGTDNPDVYDVGSDCPYYHSGSYRTARVERDSCGRITLIRGPWNEAYQVN
jgi:hypothetical protein